MRPSLRRDVWRRVLRIDVWPRDVVCGGRRECRIESDSPRAVSARITRPTHGPGAQARRKSTADSERVVRVPLWSLLRAAND